MTNQHKAYFFAAMTVLLWSTVASAFKLSLRYMEPIQLLFFANLVSVITLLAILIIQKKLYLLRTYSQRDLLRSAILGILNPFLYYLVLFKAYDLLPAQEAQPLNYTWAITLTLLSIPLLKQRIATSQLLAILISYLGVVIISTHGDLLSLRFSNPTGVALALGSTVIWALYWIYNTKDQKDPVASLFLNFLFGLPLVFLAMVVLSGLRIEHTVGLVGAAYVGLFEMSIAFVLWLNALRLARTTASVANLIFFSPFLSLLFIHFLVGEKILASTLVGLVFIVAGNILQRFGSKPIQAAPVAD
jgi:drug/metabolite transporter (DMT)-like permease